MIRPQFPTPSYSAQVARKRRYSSTAVGFPIRNDQKADCQRVSRGFPTWERARHAGAYVREPQLCVCRSSTLQHNPKAMTTTLLMVCTAPLMMQQTNTMARPYMLVTMSLGESESERTSPFKTSWSSLAVHLGVTCSRHEHGVSEHSVLSVVLISSFVVFP
jgi:hypothetical protein